MQGCAPTNAIAHGATFPDLTRNELSEALADALWETVLIAIAEITC